MLTLEETGLTLNLFKIFSILNVLPIQVDVKGGKIQRETDRVKLFIWKILFGVGVSHWLFMFGRLVQSAILEPEKYFKWDHFVLHFGITCGAAVFYFTGFRLFVQSPEENVLIFNQLYEEREDPVQKMMGLQLQRKSGNRNGSRKGNKTRVKSGTRLASTSAREPNEEDQNQSEFILETHARPLFVWPPQYSLDELLAKLNPLIVVLTGFCVLIFLAADPTRPQLLYSCLPPEWQSVGSFLLLLAVEPLCSAIFFYTGSYAVVTQLLFFGKCQLEFRRMSLHLRNLEDKFQNRSLENGGREIRREIWILRQILKEMKELALLIELFNHCFPFCIFAWKICCLSISILFYFFVIRHAEDFPALGVLIGYGGILMTLVYTITYEHAFSIPGKMEDLKNEFLLTAQKTTSKSNGNKILWAEMKKEVKKIRGVGIKVGSFHQMERESTPNFVNFVVNQVVTLLVTFPRP